MKQYKNIYLLLFALVFFKTSELRAQQEVQFTQYIFNTLSINPAYAGYKEEWFAQMALRNQWDGLEGAPKTGQFSIDGVVSPYSRNVALGLQVTSEKIGPQTATSVYTNYAYRIRLNDADTKRLSFGLGVGLAQYGLDGSKFNPVDGTDPALGYSDENVWKWNLRFGMYYYSPKWYAGVSLMDVLDKEDSYVFNSDDANYNIYHRKHLYFITGALFDLNRSFKLRPSLMVKEDFKGPTSLDLNAMFIYNERFWFGAGYRTGVKIWENDYSNYTPDNISVTNAISGIVQFYVSKRFRVGYSYDYMLNDLGNAENGTHELTLGYTFPLRGKRLLSPRFF
ncbi:type IX secretion system membrane protein PorP/SprF [Galbibacter sp. EGI 63066]|uniref:PorP/SprF family type IX secretion system membrane protein n=1 Tax=Galbibacter sp. EGI 63066 TaxID=2993559 RepID=UPI0022487B51|nr:type IX secretion system membrane protein PorP/SprF [Galbibacter sp. EGI 63066]MCX2681607.1 type IX secretion system membrane protein PorP/SprF [Galbibacter sp. EGI 63066]